MFLGEDRKGAVPKYSSSSKKMVYKVPPVFCHQLLLPTLLQCASSWVYQQNHGAGSQLDWRTYLP